MTEPQVLATARELQLLGSPRTEVMFHGESMLPLLFEGDRVIVEPVVSTDVRVGDVVTYRDRDRYPTRRLVDIGADRLVLWCDNWPRRRFVCAPTDLLGRAVARQRDGRWVAVDDDQWVTQRARALRRYRRARIGLDLRAAGGALRRAARP